MSVITHRIWTAALALTLILGSGCAKSTWTTGEPKLKRAYNERAVFWFYGAAGRARYELSDYCVNGNVARVHSELSPGNFFATFFTFGIYAPMSVEIHCSKTAERPEHQMVEADDEQ